MDGRIPIHIDAERWVRTSGSQRRTLNSDGGVWKFGNRRERPIGVDGNSSCNSIFSNKMSPLSEGLDDRSRVASRQLPVRSRPCAASPAAASYHQMRIS